MSENEWMDDPELVQLTEQMQTSAPPLTADALARVEQRMRDEIDRADRRTRWRRVALGFSLAASVLIAICTYAYLHGGSKTDAPPLVKDFAPPPVVDERITIAVTNVPPAQDKPLVRLDDYRSLFAD